MIRLLYSDLPSFKALRFHAGLNILVADKTMAATDRQSRNGAGKTSFVELIHFLFGSDAPKDSIFKHSALSATTFMLEFDLGDQTVVAGRCGSEPSKIQIRQGEAKTWPHKPKIHKKSDFPIISNEHWRIVLGQLIFGIGAKKGNGDERFHPSFRMLFPYFSRRDESKGFLSPNRHAEKQQEGDQQIALSFLLGLDWSIPQQIEHLRHKEKALTELRRMAKQGTFPDMLGKAASLRTRMTVARGRADRLREQLASFRVVPEYRNLEREATTRQREINDLINANTADRELIAQLENALNDEQPPGLAQVEKLYAEAGVILPDNIATRFEEVQAFHRKVVENRKAHLTEELHSARTRIEARETQKSELDERRAQIMRIMQEGGALEHYTRLQSELSRHEAEAETLAKQYELAEKLESSQAEYDEERAHLLRRLQSDYREQADNIAAAILLFEELSGELYEQPGSLTIDPTERGPKIEARIESSRSKGINNMQIFCFDMMLSIIAARRNIHPGFLIHDSHLFDGVDERQIAKALEIGAAHSKRHGFQYIVTMNSDDLPREGYKTDFKVEKHILPVRLTDDEKGGLFGLRFE